MITFKSQVKDVMVLSQANGDYQVKCFYKSEPVEKDATPIGLVDRIRVAQEIQELLAAFIEERAEPPPMTADERRKRYSG